MVFDNGWRQQVPWNVSTLLSDYKVTSNNTAVFNTTLVARMKFEIIHQGLFLKCQDNKHLCIFITVDFIVWKYVVCNKTLLSFSEVKKKHYLTQEGMTGTQTTPQRSCLSCMSIYSSGSQTLNFMWWSQSSWSNCHSKSIYWVSFYL